MKLKFKFDISEPSRVANWWGGHVTSFPNLVTYKGKRYEFITYDTDDTGQVDYILKFARMTNLGPWVTEHDFKDIDHLFDDGWDKCECGAAYTSFPNHHMFFCKKWSKQ